MRVTEKDRVAPSQVNSHSYRHKTLGTLPSNHRAKQANKQSVTDQVKGQVS